MRIRAERDDLADVLGRAARAVSNRSPLPILQGVLCEVEGGRLRVTGTDSEITIRTSLQVEALEEGRTLVPAKLVAEAVRKLPAGAVAMSSAGGQVEITGNGPRFRLRELNVDDYPATAPKATSGGITMDGDLLTRALNQVGVAASGDDARPTLTGVLFEADEEGSRLVATDGYRLAVRDLAGAENFPTTLVPNRALKEVARTIGDSKITVDLGEREATFGSERGSMTVRVIEGAFPPYRHFFGSFPNRLTVPREALLDAVGRASLVAEDHIPVRLNLHQGGVELSITRQEVGEETEHIEGDFQGEDMTIAFNVRYLTDGVAAVVGDDVVIHATDPVKPGLVTGTDEEGFRYLLMPVRV